jgi:hypothetical protein
MQAPAALARLSEGRGVRCLTLVTHDPIVRSYPGVAFLPISPSHP